MKEKPSKKPNPLTLRQIELLTDSILDSSGHEENVINPLLLLMDDLAHNAFDDSVIESLANCVKGRCYSATTHADEQENVYIKRVREQWAEALRTSG